MRKLSLNIVLLIVASLLSLATLEGLARGYLWSKNNLFVDEELNALLEAQNISDRNFNIYYFGGSTTRGVIPGVTIPEIVEYAFDREIQGRPIRSINLAKDGEDFQYNLIRLRQIIAKKDKFFPSLVVIYSGHNEFIKFHRALGTQVFPWFIEWLSQYSVIVRVLAERFVPNRLEAGERQFFDKPLFGKDGYDDVIDQYRQGIADAVRIMRENKIPVIVSTVAGNYADWPPNRSVFCSDKSNQNKFLGLMESGLAKEKQFQYPEAIRAYEQAIMLCDSFAETYFRLAKSYEAMERYEMAAREYGKAVEYDRMPIRAFPIQNEFIRNLEQDTYVSVVDVVRILRMQVDNGLLGFNLMIDAHHPNAKGYIAIGRAIAGAIKDKLDSGSKPLKSFSGKDAIEKFSLTRMERFNIQNWNGRWLTRMSTWRFDPSERLDMAERVFTSAMNSNPNLHESYLGLAIVNFLRKDVTAAQGYLARAKEINVDAVTLYLEQLWIKDVIKSTR